MRGKKFVSRKMMVTVVLAFAMIFSVAAQGIGAEKIPILFGTGKTGWTSYPIAVSTSDLVTRNTNLQISVRSYPGALAIVQALIQEKVSFVNGPKDTSFAMAYKAIGDFTGRPPARTLRAVIPYNALLQTIITTKKGGIKSISELKGKKLPRYLAGTNIPIESLLRANGIDIKKDIRWVRIEGEGDWREGMITGRIDAFFSDLTGGHILELAEGAGTLVAFPVEPEVLKWLKADNPKLWTGVNLTYINPGWKPHFYTQKPTPVLSTAMLVGTHANVPEEVVYNYTKTWLANMEEVRNLTKQLSAFGPQAAQTPTSMPYHKGAIKAFKEAGLWVDAMEKANREALK